MKQRRKRIKIAIRSACMHMRFTIKSNQVEESESEYLTRRSEAGCLSFVVTYFSVQERGNRKGNLTLPHSKGPLTRPTHTKSFRNGYLSTISLRDFHRTHIDTMLCIECVLKHTVCCGVIQATQLWL